MKCSLKQKIKFLVMISMIIQGYITLESREPGEMYTQNGSSKNYTKLIIDWPGICNTGFRQSPVNIIEGSNTVEDNSHIVVDYVMPKNGAEKKLYYDGDRVYMDINLGNLTYYNSKGAKEIYESNRIELHFPSEHYVTRNGQTPRYALELQIYHTLRQTDSILVTNQVIKVQQAVISILFTMGSLEEGDIFLNQLGISKYNTEDAGLFNIPQPNNFIDRKKIIPATYGVGFNYIAFQGLINLINADKHMFYYYGSETVPPCREEVLWMVYAEPRSLSKPQYDYLLLLLAKQKKTGKTLADARTPNQLRGNKRTLFLWNETMRGKIFSNPIGFKKAKSKAFYEPVE